jgi:hypothetical protein
MIIAGAESIKAVSNLRRKNVSKIQKIQIMKQYFKDYKSKMKKDEEQLMAKNGEINFDNHVTKGLFLSKKRSTACENKSSTFLFNFSLDNDNENKRSIEKVTNQLEKTQLKD